MIASHTFQLLQDITQNNEKPWFEANKDRYLQAKENITQFLSSVEADLSIHDVIEKVHLYRIYRDVRFSKDKTPYKTYFSGYASRAGAERRGSYWVKIEPNNQTMIGGGFYGPNKEDLLRIRREFEQDGQPFLDIIQAKDFVKTFGELQGDGVKTAPKGFNKEHPHIEIIRKKQFYVFKTFTDDEVQAPSFLSEVDRIFQALRPFFNYMSAVLTTDMNGESIL